RFQERHRDHDEQSRLRAHSRGEGHGAGALGHRRPPARHLQARVHQPHRRDGGVRAPGPGPHTRDSGYPARPPGAPPGGSKDRAGSIKGGEGLSRRGRLRSPLRRETAQAVHPIPAPERPGHRDPRREVEGRTEGQGRGSRRSPRLPDLRARGLERGIGRGATMILTDTHAHLSLVSEELGRERLASLVGDYARAWESTAAEGRTGSLLLDPGVDLDDLGLRLELLAPEGRLPPFIRLAAGLWPSARNLASPRSSLEALEASIDRATRDGLELAAIGECGFDNHHMEGSPEAQALLFEGQIALA